MGLQTWLVVGTKCISDGDTFSKGSRTAEFVIVANEIGVNLGTDEDAVGNVELETTSHVAHQVLAADVICTAAEAAIHVRGVEADALGAEAAHDLRSSAGAEAGSPDPIEVIEDRTIGLKPKPDVLLGAPGHLTLHA